MMKQKFSSKANMEPLEPVEEKGKGKKGANKNTEKAQTLGIASGLSEMVLSQVTQYGIYRNDEEFVQPTLTALPN